jgi:ankyrin repeat protein
MSKRCDSKDYSDIHDDLDKECFRLQERLITAALDGNINLLREALKDGANPDGTYLERGPALHMAAMKGYSDLVRELLDNNAQINREVPFQQTPLIMATYHGRSDVVRILLSRGADVCFKTLEGTADEIAQKKDYGEIAELLKVAKKQKCKAW